MSLRLPSVAQRGWDLPEDDWVFQTLHNLKNSGLVTDQYGAFFNTLPTRRTTASYAAFVVNELLARADEMNGDLIAINRKPISFREALREAQPIKERAQLFRAHREDLHSLRSVIEKLRPELTSMGHDVDELLVGIAVAATRAADVYMRIANAGEQREVQFWDVPAGHWVYDALEDGRNDGLFFGYPDEWFRGSRLATRYEMAGMVNALFQELRDQIIEIQLQVQPGDPMEVPPSLGEIARSLAIFNWALKHRRAIIQFASRF